MKTPTSIPRHIILLAHDPHFDKKGEWRVIDWGDLKVSPDDFTVLLAAAARVLTAQGRPGLYLRLVSPRGEMLAEFNPNAATPPRP